MDWITTKEAAEMTRQVQILCDRGKKLKERKYQAIYGLSRREHLNRQTDGQKLPVSKKG